MKAAWYRAQTDAAENLCPEDAFQVAAPACLAIVRASFSRMPSEVAQEVFRVLTACRSLELAMAGLYEELAALHVG
jgi:hypothetical protein